MKNHLILKAALVAAAVALSFNVQATPKKSKMSERIHLSTDTKVMPVALQQANRIHVEGGKVLKAFGNTSIVEFDRDDETGSLYVFPLVAEQVTVFVITTSGETHSITLSPKEKIPSQTITIRENLLGEVLKKVSDETDFFINNPQKVISAIGSLDLSKGKKFKAAKRSDGALTAEASSFFNVNGMRLERWILKNPTEDSVPIYEGGFYRPGDLAIATLVSELPAKGKTDLWIVKGGV